MRKNSIKTQVLPLIGMLGISVMSLSYAAAPFVPTAPPIGYVAQPEISSYKLSTGVESVYRGEYEKGGWSGNLSCYAISATGVANPNVPCWSTGTGATLKVGAQSQVDAQGFVSGSRNIATLNPAGQAIAFSVAADTVPTSGLTAATVNFIRGDRSQEAPAGALRTRLSVLGDTIHSRPFYVTDGVNPTVFYGGNDGMLHAIDATQVGGGKERWAYIPSMLIPKLNKLWANPYVHENFVDGSVNMFNVGTATTPTNILVGVLGSGGKGIYALNVTTLTAASDGDVALKALWEITPSSIALGGVKSPSTSYANLGDTYSNPTLAKIQGGLNAVIVGNGYNNTGNGHATLLVINLMTGAKIVEIDTGSGSLASPNGLSTPAAVDSNGDGMVDTVYAGDIDGNMWKFDLLTNTSKLLYATGQSITMMPGVSQHPFGGYMVNFATGRILTTADAADTAIHYVYGIWDSAPAGNTTLITQTITSRQYAAATGAVTVPVRVVGTTPNAAVISPNWSAGGDKGWKAALPAAGERVTGDSAFDLSGFFYFNATNPTATYTYTPPTGAAVTGTGENWMMVLDNLTGGGAFKPIFDMNTDGVLSDADRVRYAVGDTIPAPSVVGDPIPTSFGNPVGFATSNGVQSQPFLSVAGTSGALFYNQNWDLTPASTTTSTNKSTTGIGGGHFDADMFWNQGGKTFSWKENDHQHEYDKMFDVNGVNFLNPNDPTEKLSVALDPATGKNMTPTTRYKVLLMNQGWNRAMKLTLGTRVWDVKDYLTGPYKVNDPVTGLNYNPYAGKYNQTYAALWTAGATGVGALKMSSLPTYTGVSSSVGTAAADYVLAPATQPASPAAIVPKFNLVTVKNVAATGSISCGGTFDLLAPAVAGLVTPGASADPTHPLCSDTTVTTGPRLDSKTGVGVGGFELSMPDNAFQQLDWWGDGVIQTGVMPTNPACPDASNADGTDVPFTANAASKKQFSGKLGERNDGVITVQVVKDTTPDSAVQMNVPGRPDLGFRVIDGVANFQKYVIAEYIIYWHHPSALCYGDDKTAWALANNDGDPWWPAQESGNAPDTVGSANLGALSYTTTAKCGPNGSNSKPAWIATKPASTWTLSNGNLPAAAWTTPPGWPPAGFTMTPPLDTATTLPLCPDYSKLCKDSAGNPWYCDDPRTASFVTSSPGTTIATKVTTTNATLTNLPTNLIAGGVNLSGCVGAACPAPCVGAACNKACGTAGQPACTAKPLCGTPNGPVCPPPPKMPTIKVISWHELLRP